MSIFKVLTATKKTKNIEKLKEIENVYNFQFPSIYLKFQSTYEVGQYTELWDAYLNKSLSPTPMYEIKIRYNDVRYDFNWLYSPNQIFHELKNNGAKEMLTNHQLLRIGEIVQSDGIFVGVGEDNKEQIFIFFNEADELLLHVGDTINEFIDNLTIIKKKDTDDLKKMFQVNTG